MLTVCFTGRRPKDLYGYDKEKYIPLVDTLTSELEQLYLNGYKNFISGGAQGFDQLAFWAVNRLKKKYSDIKNILYIPFPGQESMWLKTGFFSQAEYQLMVSLADEIHYCANNKPVSKWEINNALHQRNHDMVNNSDLIFGLYPNDLWVNENTRGGTAECLRYAKDKNKKIYILHPFTLKADFFEY